MPFEIGLPTAVHSQCPLWINRGRAGQRLSTALDDFSRYIIAWKLCTTMKAQDVTDMLDLALAASGCDQTRVVHKPRLLSDKGSSYVSAELVMSSSTDISILYRKFTDALTEVLAENAGGPARRGRLARARAAVKKHSDYSEHGHFLAVETAFKQWEAMQNISHANRPS